MQSFNSFYTSNRAFLHTAEISSRLLSWCVDDMPDSVEIVVARTNALTMRYKNVMLHSQYDPVKEAQRFAASQDISPGDHVLVYGFGLGYHLLPIIEAVGPYGKVIVFEPNAEIVQAAFILVDWQTIFIDRRVQLIAGNDEELLAMKLASYVQHEFQMVPEERKKVVVHLASYHALPADYTAIKEVFDLMLIDRKAGEIFSTIAQDNCIQNLDLMLSSPSLASLQAQFSGKPAFFVNAGPSFDIALPHLEEFFGSSFVFTSDTTYAFLKQVGVPVDVMFSVDPQAETAKHFTLAGNDTALLMALPTMHAESLQRYEGPKMCVLQKNSSITKRCEDVLHDKAFTTAGGSVSCVGLDIMLQLGCNPIIFVGMDYAFPGYKFYSTNTVETKKWFGSAGRYHTVEMMHLEVIKEQKVRMVKDAEGCMIPTHQTLYLYRRQIESLIGRHPQTTFYNFMSRGSYIAGTEPINSPDALHRVLQGDAIDKEVSILYEQYSDEKRDQVRELLKA